ncbi:MAG: 30S ribosome-binding factor RbfA [Deltaproteobacteria bacterium]|nr:30S ribosome-binding factor RbfA [Deltaproteobacteria bacterium]
MNRSKDRKARRGDILPATAEPERKVPRRLRVEGEIFEQMSLAVIGLEDPRLAGITVTRVQMTDDLRLARVYVHCTGSGADADEARRRAIVKALESASNRLRRLLGATLDLRYVPELRFFYDSGVDHARRIDELLAEIKEGQS